MAATHYGAHRLPAQIKAKAIEIRKGLLVEGDAVDDLDDDLADEDVDSATKIAAEISATNEAVNAIIAALVANGILEEAD